MMLALGIGLLAVFALQMGLFYGVQVRATDFLFRAADRASAGAVQSPRVAVVAIDDDSLTELGKLSDWPRSYYAVVTRQLREAGARVIAFDLLFAEEAEGDDEFATEIGLAGNVVLPVVETTTLARNGTTGSNATTPAFESALPQFSDNAKGTGHANVYPDADGVVRRVPAGISSPSGTIPALGVVIANLVGPQDDLYMTDDSLLCGATLVPLDAMGSMIVNYATAVGDRAPVTVPFVDVLRGEADLSLLKDKAVLVGATAVGLQDAYWTPCGRLMSGVLIHAAVAETMVAEEPLRRASAWPLGLLCLGLSLLGWILVTRLGTARSLLGLAGTLVIFVATVLLAFDHGLLLDMFYPPATLLAAFATVSVHSSASERARRRQLASAFGRFVSAPVAAQIMAALEEGTLSLGGTQRQATVLFADIRGFTSLASYTRPQALVRITNAYLKVAVEAVNEEGGVVNKFGGDSIMAVWNAPTDCPSHSVRAVRAGLAIQRRAAALANADSTLPSLAFGIGINTGEVVAGTLGAEERLEYSVLGDTVNVAARVTALAPGGAVWVTEAMAASVCDKFSLEDLGTHELKGRDEQIRLMHVLGPLGGDSKLEGTNETAASANRGVTPKGDGASVERTRPGTGVGTQTWVPLRP